MQRLVSETPTRFPKLESVSISLANPRDPQYRNQVAEERGTIRGRLFKGSGIRLYLPPEANKPVKESEAIPQEAWLMREGPVKVFHTK